MKKSKFFIGAGALVLAVSAFTNANNKKYAGTNSAYFLTNSVNWNTLFKNLNTTADAPKLTDVSITNKTAFFKTVNSPLNNGYQLYKAKSTSSGNTLFVK